MKFGVAAYAMNVEDGGDYDLELRLKGLKKIGYAGIERLEAASAADALAKADVFHRLKMDFATCRGTCVEHNIAWSSAFGKEYTWLMPGDHSRETGMDDFCRRCSVMLRACAAHGIRGALHNHLGARIQNPDELDYFMEKCPEAQLLFDIGHYHGAGGDVMAALEKYYPRLAAIHLKEIFYLDRSLDIEAPWRKRLYFCGLGSGNGDLDNLPVIDFLMKKNYSGWCLMEPDFYGVPLLEDLEKSLNAVRQAFPALLPETEN